MIDYEGWDTMQVYPLGIASKLWYSSENQVDLNQAPPIETNKFHTLLSEAISVGQLKVEYHHWSLDKAGMRVPAKVTWENLVHYFHSIDKDLPEFLLLPIFTSASFEQDPEESQTEKLEEFIRRLRVWSEFDTEIKIQKPGKKPYIANNDNLEFKNTNTKAWKALIAVLKDPKHIIYYDKNMSAEKQIFLEIERKLLKNFSKILEIEFPKDFKLVESIKGEKGKRRFKFWITPHLEKVGEDYSECDKEQIKKEFKKLAYHNADVDDYNNVYKQARKLGMTDDEIGKIINDSQAIQDATDYDSGFEKI